MRGKIAGLDSLVSSLDAHFCYALYSERPLLSLFFQSSLLGQSLSSNYDPIHVRPVCLLKLLYFQTRRNARFRVPRGAVTPEAIDPLSTPTICAIHSSCGSVINPDCPWGRRFCAALAIAVRRIARIVAIEHRRSAQCGVIAPCSRKPYSLRHTKDACTCI